MRGLGDFQRSQMKQKDPRVTEFFSHLRKARDTLEQLSCGPRPQSSTQSPGLRSRSSTLLTSRKNLKDSRTASKKPSSCSASAAGLFTR